MNYTSSIGLILDIIGVIMLFIYGLPSKIKEQDYIGKEETKEDIRVKKMAYIGLSFILFGFILQLFGINIS